MRDDLFIIDDHIEYYNKNGKLHREDGPAIIYTDGSKYWYKNGLLHREGAPAIVFTNGDKQWYKEGKRYFPVTMLTDQIVFG